MAEKDLEAHVTYEIIKEALNPETHKRIHNDVGVELQKVLKNYEEQIRKSSKIDDVKKFNKDLKGAIAKVLAKHLKMEKQKGAVNALADSITDAVYRDTFGFDALQSEKELSEKRISNYDDFAHDYIRGTREHAVQKVYMHGVTGVEQHMRDSKKRPEFFTKSEKDLGSNFKWTDHAKKTSDDYAHVAGMLSAGIGGKMSQDLAKDSKKHVQYRGK